MIIKIHKAVEHTRITNNEETAQQSRGALHTKQQDDGFQKRVAQDFSRSLTASDALDAELFLQITHDQDSMPSTRWWTKQLEKNLPPIERSVPCDEKPSHMKAHVIDALRELGNHNDYQRLYIGDEIYSPSKE